MFNSSALKSVPNSVSSSDIKDDKIEHANNSPAKIATPGKATSLENSFEKPLPINDTGCDVVKNDLVDNSSANAQPAESELPFEKLTGVEKLSSILDTWETISDYNDKSNHELCFKTLKALSQCYWKEQSLRQVMAELLIERDWQVSAHTALKAITQGGLFASDEIWFSTYYILNCLWNFSDCSISFAKKLNDAGVMVTMKSYITHEPFLSALNTSKNIFYVVKSALSITHNITRAPDVSATFKKLQISETVRPFLRENTYTNDEFIQALCALIVANVSEDGDDLSDTEHIIDFIVDCMKKALEHVKQRFRGFTPTELAHGLAKLTSTDANKFKIVKAGALPIFNIMLKGNDTEQQLSAARAIWGLAFDDNASKRILTEPEMMTNLASLLKSSNEDVKNAAHGAIWILNKELDHRNETTYSNRKAKAKKVSDGDLGKRIPTQPLIFLSYSWGNQEMALSIFTRLKSLGHKVWIDVEQMTENLLESMAEGIEAANVVVILISETYKSSPNCRTEAEYSYKLRKCMIPVMVQSAYQPSGWLGLIIGTKLYFDFASRPFDEIFPQFQKELQKTLWGKAAKVEETVQKTVAQPNVAPATTSTSQSINTNQSVRQWSNTHVQQWLAKSNLHRYLEPFKGVDGAALCSLYDIKKEAPEYFYRLLETKIGFSFPDLLRFRLALENLHK